jgi:hypothetical protein
VCAAASGRVLAGEAVLGNQFLELRFAGGRCVELAHKLAKRTIPLQEDDFSVGVEGQAALHAADFAFQGAHEEAMPGGRRLTLRSHHAARGMQLAVVYELSDGDFVARRRLEVQSQNPLPLREVTVWSAKVGGTCSHQGYGEPVFLEDTFWGIEFPAAENRFADGTVRLSQFPGRTTDKFQSKPAVIGVAEPGRVAQRFRDYVRSFQATHEATRLFVNYNTWWTLMPPTEANCLELIETFRKNLFEPHGESFDTFTIDDGWDDKETLWAIRSGPFPHGLAPLVGPLKAMKANLGLWLSPSSGYSHAPHLAKQGYEHNSNPWFCCQSGPKYRKDIVARVTELAKQYDLAFYKFDGFSATCEAAGHGHLPGPFAKEANVDAFLELMTAARQAKPGIYLDPTCGIWLSPWWLRTADSLWGEVSGDYPDILVPAPIVRDSATTTRDAVFRQRCREHPGFPPSAIEHLGIIVISPEKWEDNAVAVVGRGARLLTLYLNPRFFTKGAADWAFLASLLKWTRHHAATLARTELVGGDPMKREVYGYAHFAGPRGILCLRNPFIEPQTIQVKLDEAIGWPADAPGMAIARIVYPREEVLGKLFRRGDTLAVTLQGYETLLLHIEPYRADQPLLLGLRAREARRNGTRVDFEAYGRSGQDVAVGVLGRPRRVLLDGQPIEAAGVTTDGQVTSLFPGPGARCSVEGAALQVRAEETSWRLEGHGTATVPAGTKAAMHVLCDPRTGGKTQVECTAQVGGKAVEVRAVRTPEKGEQAHGPHPWTWFEFPLPEGRSEVALVIRPAKEAASFRGEVGWWLWAEHPLKKRVLTVQFDQPLPPAEKEPLPVPVSMETQREIITIHAPKVVRTPRTWAKLDQPVVFLDELEPDEATQGWGTLQRNQSVWEKPMTVAGRKFARGLGTHASARVVYELAGGGFKTFRCLVGRDEHAMDGRIAFEVWADGKKAFDSGPMTQTSAAKAVEVSVAGAATLELRTLDGGDGVSGDHGDWAEAQLVREEKR